jgi:acetyl esterase
VSSGSLSARQRVEFRVARFLSLRSPRTQVRLAGGRPTRRDGLTLEPDVQLVLALAERQGAVPIEQLPPPQARAMTRQQAAVAAGPPPPVAEVRDLRVAGGAGERPARLYVPERAGEDLVLFLHGGGFVIGDLETHDVLCRLLARGTGARVLAVDYRLAPEHPFPAAVEDAVAAFRWAVEHAAELGARPDRIAVAGDSAGANLATVTAWTAVREGTTAPCLQLLFYPVTDRSSDWPSHREFDEGFFLTREQMDWFEAAYVGHVDGDDDPRFSILHADLAGMPPAIVATAGFDPLRDEGEAYARALQDAGTPVVLRRFDGQIHGFASMTGIVPSARDAVAETAGMARALLAARVVAAV